MHTLNEGTQEELGITTTHGYDDHSDGGYGLEAPSAAHSGFISESEYYSSPQQSTNHHHTHQAPHSHPHNPHHLTHHHALHHMQEVKFHPLQSQHHSPSPASSASSPYNNNNNNNNTNGTSNGSSKSAAFLSRGS